MPQNELERLIQRIADDRVRQHEREFVALGIIHGAIVGSILASILLWLVGVVYWLGQRL